MGFTGRLPLDTDYVLLRQEPKSRLSEGAAYRETSYTSNGTTQTETANSQNQITSISGSTTPTYDNNGNMTTDQSGNTFTYNAWNQLVTAKNSSGQIIVQYTYDARGYRVSESYPIGGNGIPAGTTKYLYYSTQEQVIEERWNGTAASDVQYQYVWSASYVNAMVLRDTYSGGTLQANDRIYTTYDASYDVTSLVGYESSTQKWDVVERFKYTPYGTVMVLLASLQEPTTDAYSWQYMYQGGRQDPITGLYHFDHRDYSTSLGRFISQDPLQYVNGANTYQFVMGNPVGNVDPWGKDSYGTVPTYTSGPTLSPVQGVAAIASGVGSVIGNSGAFLVNSATSSILSSEGAPQSSWPQATPQQVGDVTTIAGGGIAFAGAVTVGPEITIGGAIFTGLDFVAGGWGMAAGTANLVNDSLGNSGSDIPASYWDYPAMAAGDSLGLTSQQDGAISQAIDSAMGVLTPESSVPLITNLSQLNDASSATNNFLTAAKIAGLEGSPAGPAPGTGTCKW